MTRLPRQGDVPARATRAVEAAAEMRANDPSPRPQEIADPYGRPAKEYDQTVEHISDDVSFMFEIRRVLRPGGTLLVSSPNMDISAPDGVLLNRWHVREYTLSSLTALLRRAGLEVGYIYVQSFPPKIRRGHRIAWRLNGLTWTQPSCVRAATRPLFGDVEVRPRDDGQPPPGYWVVSAKKGAPSI